MYIHRIVIDQHINTNVPAAFSLDCFVICFDSRRNKGKEKFNSNGKENFRDPIIVAVDGVKVMKSSDFRWRMVEIEIEQPGTAVMVIEINHGG